MRGEGNGQRRRFVYNRADPKVLEQVANQPTTNYVQINKADALVFKASAGNNRLRILPPTWEGADHYAYPIIVHYNVGPDGARYLCLKMLGKPCAICADRVQLVRHGEGEAAKQTRPQDGRVAWVIDRNKQDQGPQLWFFGKSAESEYAILARDEDSGDVLYIDDPDEGYDITFKCDNPGKHADYSARRIVRNPSPLSDNPKRMDAWLDYIQNYPVPDALQFYTYNQMLEALGGEVEEKDTVEPERIRSRSIRDEVEPEPEYDPDTGETYEPEPEPDLRRPLARDVEYEETPTPRQAVAKRDVQDEPEHRPQRPRPPAHDETTQQARQGLRELRPPGVRPSARR